MSPFSRSVKLCDFSIDDFLSGSVEKACEFIHEVVCKEPSLAGYVGDALTGLEKRLSFINQVGLGYLTLDRPYKSLSEEAQRARLATQLGMGLVGVIYALDEPSVGLHPADHQRLLSVLRELRDLGNTVIVVEHDADTLLACDHLIEVGPAPGERGGEIVFEGSVKQCLVSNQSSSGPFLDGREKIVKDVSFKLPGKAQLLIREARANNLDSIDVSFPVGLLTVVCGVSGSGKSSLVNEVLAKSAAMELHRSKVPGAHSGIQGFEHFNKLFEWINLPSGKARSNPPPSSKFLIY